MVLVTVAGTAPGRTEQSRGSTSFSPDALELVPELAAQPSDHRVVKRTWGAFTDTGLERHLRSLGVTQVLLAGIATSIGVESTAPGARGRLPREPRRRCHDRHERGGACQQRRAHLPAPGRDRHQKCLPGAARAEAAGAVRSTFRSLAGYNYRLWAAGALVSNVGTWMQRTAQDWIVLTQLTKHDATAVGIVMSLQFGPQFLLLPLTGYVADGLDRRKLLFFTQAAMALLALGLGVLTLWARCSCGRSTCSLSCSDASAPSTRPRARASWPSWWAMRTCRTRWR